MVKLIDADNLLAGIYTDNPDDVMRYIASCDAVEAVPLVKCEDCRHRNLHEPRENYCEIFDMWMPKDFYCKEWEKRTDG